MSIPIRWVTLVVVLAAAGCRSDEPQPMRIASYNTSLYRDADGQLVADLEAGSEQARKVAAVLQHVRPDVVLLNEFDYDEAGRAASLFVKRYLQVAQSEDLQPITYDHRFSAPVNTGVPSGLDLDGDGESDGPADAFGFGRHPGQYGMLVLSRHPIDEDRARTFQELLWQAMPDHAMPEGFWPDETAAQLRLSSKSHWDVPIRVDDAHTLHLLASHPTPPVFDGAEDRNGRRNHDEIRLWNDYLTSGASAWIVDDQGRSGGLEDGSMFVIAGDLNADPADGDSYRQAIRQLLDHPPHRRNPRSRESRRRGRRGGARGRERGTRDAGASGHRRLPRRPGPREHASGLRAARARTDRARRARVLARSRRNGIDVDRRVGPPPGLDRSGIPVAVGGDRLPDRAIIGDMTSSLRVAIATLGSLCAIPAQDQPVISAAEASGFTRTSTLAEMQAFLDALSGDRLTVEEFGRSQEDRPLLWVRVAPPATAADVSTRRIRVLVVANIHGGEVCGKDAVQLLIREMLQGEHDELFASLEIAFVPIYNVDGNEKIDPANRSNCNGPVEGLGERANAQGFDLNRDCIKTESPEFRALLGLFARYDPHVLMDLHTTNGSPHAYHLTYAPPLATNVDPAIDRFLREVHLPAVRTAAAERHGYRMFDYGNFSRRGTPQTFATFDHRPRFLTNYYGLRNRLAVLSEAYAYEPFEVRVRASRAFVLENLRAAAAQHESIAQLCKAADDRARDGDGTTFGWNTSLVEGEQQDILVGTWDRVPLGERRTRVTRRSEFRAVPMTVKVAFASADTVSLPSRGWAILDPSEDTRTILAAHGIESELLTDPGDVVAAQFLPTSGDKSRREFQGHREIRLRGEWTEATKTTLPPGTLIVSSRQRLARLAAQLLEPQSEDGLATWNGFEEQTVIASDDAPGRFPVLRLTR